MFTVIETSESQENITMLSERLRNGKVHQAAIEERTKDNALKLSKDQLLEKTIPTENSQGYSNGILTKCIDSKISQANMEWTKMSPLSTDVDMEYATSSFTQFKILFSRMMLQLRRNTTGLLFCITKLLQIS